MRWSELTPRGGGGVSVLALTGGGALDAVRRLAPDARLERGRLVLARLVIEGELIDEALVCVHSGEHVELHCHGSPPLVRRLGREFGGGDRRVVSIGPCTDAAFAAPLSGNQREAWRRLPSADSESAARMLLDQAEGALERELARIDGLPEAGRVDALRRLDERSRAARWLTSPPRLLLAGPINAGKSTLFNALLGRRRAITSELAGTTRDLLRETAQLGDWAVRLVDSAGDRALGADLDVERAGQDLGRRERGTADLTLWLQPPGAPEPPPEEPGERRVVLASRGDHPAAEAGALQPLERPTEARERIVELLRRELDLPPRAWTPGAGVRIEPLCGA